MTIKIFEHIIEELREIISGTEFEGKVYAVGGCVRDRYMNHEIKDIDIVVEKKNGGTLFAEWMRDNGHTSGDVVTYPTYGTAMFRYVSDDVEYEIECVQTRKEQYHDRNSRNPETCYGPIYDDCMRRDLTINSLYLNISNGTILDMTGRGINDITEHIIRTTDKAEVIFDDDPLRILRCIRFASRYGWKIDEETVKGIEAMRDRLSIISQERITDEFNKMMSSDGCLDAVGMLRDYGVMKYVMPEIMPTYDMEQNKYHFGTVWNHTISVLEHVRDRGLILKIAALLHDIGKVHTCTYDEGGQIHFYGHEEESEKMCRQILRRMKYPNEVIEEVAFLVKNHMATKQWGDGLEHMKEEKLRKLMYECGGMNRFVMLMELIHADNVSHAPTFCMPNQVNAIYAAVNSMIDDGTDMFGYTMPITGNDVMEYFGIPQGKKVGKYMEYALKFCFKKPRITKDELLHQLRSCTKTIDGKE